MKKTTLILVLIFSIALSYAQPTKLTSAWNYLKYGEIENAKEAIDPCTTHPKTMYKQKTWLFYGQIYHAINDSCMYNKSEKFCNLAPDALNKAYNGYMKAWVLNFKNPEYRKLNLDDSTDNAKFFTYISNQSTKYLDMEYQYKIFTGTATLTNSFVNEGLVAYQKEKDYKKALEYFNKAFFLSQLKSMLDGGEMDTDIIYYIALAAEQAKMYPEARESYKQLIKAGYGAEEKDKAALYIYVANTYKAEKNDEKYLNALNKGREKYANSSEILIELINYYILADKSAEAKEIMIAAIEKEPNNKLLHFNVGTIYEKEGNIEEAAVSYTKALEVDPKYFDAAYNLGALYLNTAVEMSKKCDDIPPTKKAEYKKCKEEATNKFKEALPRLENAYGIDAKDKFTINALKSVYARLGDEENYKKMKTELEGLK